MEAGQRLDSGSEHNEVGVSASLDGESMTTTPKSGAVKERRVILASNARCESVDKDKPFIVLIDGEFRNVDKDELIKLKAKPYAIHSLPASGGVATAVKQIDSVPKCLVAPDAAPKESSAHCSREELESLKREFPALFAKTDLTLFPISDWEKKCHYGDVSNGHYWPAFHKLLLNLPDNYPSRSAYETYHQVNRRMADYIVKEATSEKAARYDDIIWVHDYQLCEVPMMVRETLPDAKVGFFLHIPFCEPNDFIASMGEGHARDVIRGLLGSDLIAFHVPEYANKFVACCKELGYQVEDTGSGRSIVVPEVDRDGKPVLRLARVIAAPISIDAENIRRVIQYDPAKGEREKEIEDGIENAVKWRKDNPGMKLLLGAERLDYSKGIPERILAIKYILEHEDEFPGAARNFVFRQEAVLSRPDVREYQLLGQSVRFLVKETNDYARAKYRDHKYARLADAVERITKEVNDPQVDVNERKEKVTHYEPLERYIKEFFELVEDYEGDKTDPNYLSFVNFANTLKEDIEKIGSFSNPLEAGIESLKNDVNEYARSEYPSKAWDPIVYGSGIKQKSLYAHSAIADAIIVNPEYDGMNLVIKEAILAKFFAQHSSSKDIQYSQGTQEFLNMASSAGSAFILGKGTGAAMELENAGLSDNLRIVDGRDRRTKEQKEEYIKELAESIYGALGLGAPSPEAQRAQHEEQVENVETLAEYYKAHNLRRWVERNLKEIDRAASARWNQTGAVRLSAGTIEKSTEYGRARAQGLRPAQFSRVVNDSVIMRQDLESQRVLRALEHSKGNITWVATLDEQQAATSPLFRTQLGELLHNVPSDKLHLILRDDVDSDEIRRIIPRAIIHSEDEIQQNRWIETKFNDLRYALLAPDFLNEYSLVNWSVNNGELIASFDKYGTTLRPYERESRINQATEMIMKIAQEEADFREGELVVTRKGDRLFLTARVLSPEYIIREARREDPSRIVVLISEKADDVSAFEKSNFGIFVGHTDGSPRKAYGLDNVFNILSFGDMGPLLRRYARM